MAARAPSGMTVRDGQGDGRHDGSAGGSRRACPDGAAAGRKRPRTGLRTVLASLLLALPLAQVGCGLSSGGGNLVKLEAYAEKVDYSRRFFILPGVTEARASDRDFRMAADLLAQALEAQGYTRAPSLEQADLGLYLGYAVTAQDNTPVETRPQGGLGAYSPRMISFVDYTREMTLEAVDMARYHASHPSHVVWRVRLVSRGPTAGLEKVMPAFAAAVAQYAGTSGDFTLEVAPDMTVRPAKPEQPKRTP